MAYNAEINVSVKNLNQVADLETKLSSISRNVNALNKGTGGGGRRGGGGGGGSAKSELSDEQKRVQLANKRLTIQNRGLGVTRQALDLQLKGKNLDEATNKLAEVKALTDQDQLDLAKNKILLADQQVKKKGLELKAEQAINAEAAKSKEIRGLGPSSPVFGRPGQIGSAANMAAINQDPLTSVSPVQRKLQEMEKRSARNQKQAELRRKKSLSIGQSNIKNLKAELRLEKAKGIAANKTADARRRQIQAGISPQGDFSRLSDRQSRNREGGRTFMNNPFGRRGIRPTRGFDAQSALISGGFPLLFGQGPGVAAAGALGGGIGGMFGQMGGFAGGIAATAAVQSIQNVINGIGELGQAMNRLNPNISAMSQAMGISGTMEQKRLQLIEQNQGKQAAFNAALEMMGEKIGADKAAELQKFGETFRDLTNSVTLFFTKVQAAVAKMLNQATEKVKETFIKPGEARKFVRENPNNPAFADINAQIAALKGTGSGKGRFGAKQVSDKRNSLKAERLEIAKTLLQKKEEEEVEKNISQLVTSGLGDLREKNNLHLATINGTREEFEIQKAIKDKVEEMGLTMTEIEGTERQRIENAIRTNKQLEEQAENAEKIREAFKNLSVTIKDDIKNGIAGLIKGTATLGDMLNNIADKLINVGLDHILFGSVLGAGGPKGGGLLGLLGFANGGKPPVGKPSIVGEKGPELFVPKRSGTIIPNDKLAGGGSTNISVNVDASGSSVQGDEQQSKELGRLISVAIQSELIKQRRPGGLLR